MFFFLLLLLLGRAIFQFPMYSFWGVKRQKLCLKRCVKRQKLCISWCIDLSKTLCSTPQISESIPFLFGGSQISLYLANAPSFRVTGGGARNGKRENFIILRQGWEKEASPPPPSFFLLPGESIRCTSQKKGNRKRADAQQRHSVFSPLYQESAVCYTTSWREGKRKGKKCSGADKWKEKWEGERLIWKMEMAPDEIWEKGSVGGRKYCTFIAAALAR